MRRQQLRKWIRIETLLGATLAAVVFLILYMAFDVQKTLDAAIHDVAGRIAGKPSIVSAALAPTATEMVIIATPTETPTVIAIPSPTPKPTNTPLPTNIPKAAPTGIPTIGPYCGSVLSYDIFTVTTRHALNSEVLYLQKGNQLNVWVDVWGYDGTLTIRIYDQNNTQLTDYHFANSGFTMFSAPYTASYQIIFYNTSFLGGNKTIQAKYQVCSQ